ncbi:four-carbon acid sugar kinase family protein, partial [Klebsiella pneumoniae]|uniref:four-carbon acid sugar kinase family protein n=1 Tax=Klebsiella pneumoniae TaxID=573 RepID=UPI001F052AC9
EMAVSQSLAALRWLQAQGCQQFYFKYCSTFDSTAQGTVAKLAMRQPFVLFKGLTFQKLCLPGAFRPGDHHN